MLERDQLPPAENNDGAVPAYKVGHRHPPLHTRFKPGVSGNPSGRPKDSKNLKTLLHAILNEQISLQDGNQSRKVSKAEAIMRRLIIGALKGDSRDLHALFRLAEQTGQFEEPKDEITRIERVIFSTVYEANDAKPSGSVPVPASRPFNRED
jgi:Family of unknown function (DUF5681)